MATGDVRAAPRAGLHRSAARRRDQPHAAAHAGRAARGDGGAAGHDRRHQPPSAAVRSRRSRRRTRSSSKARIPLPEARARSLSGEDSGRLSADAAAGEEEAILERHHRGFDARALDRASTSRRSRPQLLAQARVRRAAVRVEPALFTYIATHRRGGRATGRRSHSASARAAAFTCCSSPRRWPQSTAATTCCPTT